MVPVVQNFATRCPTDLAGVSQIFFFQYHFWCHFWWGIPKKFSSVTSGATSGGGSQNFSFWCHFRWGAQIFFPVSLPVGAQKIFFWCHFRCHFHCGKGGSQIFFFNFFFSKFFFSIFFPKKFLFFSFFFLFFQIFFFQIFFFISKFFFSNFFQFFCCCIFGYDQMGAQAVRLLRVT